MIKHPKLASRSSSSSIRRLKKFRFNETFDKGFKTRIHSYIDSTYPTAYFDDFYDLHDEKKMITLAELKEKLKIYYHNTYHYIPQIIQNWSVYSRFCHVAPKKKKKSTLKYTLIGTPTLWTMSSIRIRNYSQIESTHTTVKASILDLKNLFFGQKVLLFSRQIRVCLPFENGWAFEKRIGVRFSKREHI